jgi:hypothetical protein
MLFRILRSILAVVAGAIAALAAASIIDWMVVLLFPAATNSDGPMPTALVGSMITYTALCTVLGGYLSAWIGGRAPVWHGLALGLVFLALGGSMWVAMLIVPMPPEQQKEMAKLPAWYMPVSLPLAVLAATLGGYLRGMRQGPAPTSVPLPAEG